MKRRFQGIWIPAALWLSTQLTLREKALIAEIYSLSDDEAGCYASNAHLAKMLGVAVGRIANIISDLRFRGLLSAQYDDKNHRIDLRVADKALHLFGIVPQVLEGGSRKREGGVHVPDKGGSRKREGGVHENVNIDNSIDNSIDNRLEVNTTRAKNSDSIDPKKEELNRLAIGIFQHYPKRVNPDAGRTAIRLAIVRVAREQKKTIAESAIIIRNATKTFAAELTRLNITSRHASWQFVMHAQGWFNQSRFLLTIGEQTEHLRPREKSNGAYATNRRTATPNHSNNDGQF